MTSKDSETFADAKEYPFVDKSEKPQTKTLSSAKQFHITNRTKKMLKKHNKISFCSRYVWLTISTCPRRSFSIKKLLSFHRRLNRWILFLCQNFIIVYDYDTPWASFDSSIRQMKLLVLLQWKMCMDRTIKSLVFVWKLVSIQVKKIPKKKNKNFMKQEKKSSDFFKTETTTMCSALKGLHSCLLPDTGYERKLINHVRYCMSWDKSESYITLSMLLLGRWSQFALIIRVFLLRRYNKLLEEEKKFLFSYIGDKNENYRHRVERFAIMKKDF